MTDHYCGGCACGKLRYKATAEPLASNHCQCLDCQQTSGTGHASLMVFPRIAVEIEGDAAEWNNIADSGKQKSRGFCPTCGSPVYITVEVAPHVIVVHAASLDDPSRFKPERITYGMRGFAWDACDPTLPKYEKLPPH
jgi:hypothetical protein